MTGTYYWYMYLLKFEDLPISGINKKTDDPVGQSRASAEKDDIEASAESSRQVTAISPSH